MSPAPKSASKPTRRTTRSPRRRARGASAPSTSTTSQQQSPKQAAVPVVVSEFPVHKSLGIVGSSIETASVLSSCPDLVPEPPLDPAAFKRAAKAAAGTVKVATTTTASKGAASVGRGNVVAHHSSSPTAEDKDGRKSPIAGAKNPLTAHAVLGKAKARELADVRELNVWGHDLDDISVLSRCPNLRILSVSVNRLTTLAPLAGLTKLEELYVRNNRIGAHSSDGVLETELKYLASNKQLHTLWMCENPAVVAAPSEDEYRRTVARVLPQVRKLDNLDISAADRTTTGTPLLVISTATASGTNNSNKSARSTSGTSSGSSRTARPPTPVSKLLATSVVEGSVVPRRNAAATSASSGGRSRSRSRDTLTSSLAAIAGSPPMSPLFSPLVVKSEGMTSPRSIAWAETDVQVAEQQQRGRSRERRGSALSPDVAAVLHHDLETVRAHNAMAHGSVAAAAPPSPRRALSPDVAAALHHNMATVRAHNAKATRSVSPSRDHRRGSSALSPEVAAVLHHDLETVRAHNAKAGPVAAAAAAPPPPRRTLAGLSSVDAMALHHDLATVRAHNAKGATRSRSPPARDRRTSASALSPEVATALRQDLATVRAHNALALVPAPPHPVATSSVVTVASTSRSRSRSSDRRGSALSPGVAAALHHDLATVRAHNAMATPTKIAGSGHVVVVGTDRQTAQNLAALAHDLAAVRRRSASVPNSPVGAAYPVAAMTAVSATGSTTEVRSRRTSTSVAGLSPVDAMALHLDLAEVRAHNAMAAVAVDHAGPIISHPKHVGHLSPVDAMALHHDMAVVRAHNAKATRSHSPSRERRASGLSADAAAALHRDLVTVRAHNALALVSPPAAPASPSVTSRPRSRDRRASAGLSPIDAMALHHDLAVVRAHNAKAAGGTTDQDAQLKHEHHVGHLSPVDAMALHRDLATVRAHNALAATAPATTPTTPSSSSGRATWATAAPTVTIAAVTSKSGPILATTTGVPKGSHNQNNVLFAVLALVKDLDRTSLEVVRSAVVAAQHQQQQTEAESAVPPQVQKQMGARPTTSTTSTSGSTGTSTWADTVRVRAGSSRV